MRASTPTSVEIYFVKGHQNGSGPNCRSSALVAEAKPCRAGPLLYPNMAGWPKSFGLEHCVLGSSRLVHQPSGLSRTSWTALTKTPLAKPQYQSQGRLLCADAAAKGLSAQKSRSRRHEWVETALRFTALSPSLSLSPASTILQV